MALYRDDATISMNHLFCKKMGEFLHTANDRKIALKYLQQRKMTKAMIKKFDIGWFPNEVDVPRKIMHLKQLQGRVIFPIKDEYGDIISFSGRLPENKIEDVCKYWHESYAKSFFFYGLDVA